MAGKRWSEYTELERAAMSESISEGVRAAWARRTESERAAIGSRISESNKATNLQKIMSTPPLVVPEGFGEWFTGFWEGDGTVLCWDTIIGCWNVFRTYISIQQKDSSVLEYIRSVLGYGTLFTRGDGGTQIAFESQKRCYPLLKLISGCVVSEHSRRRLEPVLTRLKMPLAEAHEPTVSWIAGFWEAEGSASVMDEYGSMKVYIAQKERFVLEEIQKVVGGNLRWVEQSGAHHLVMYGDIARSFAESILPFVVGNYKHYQLELCVRARDVARSARGAVESSNWRVTK